MGQTSWNMEGPRRVLISLFLDVGLIYEVRQARFMHCGEVGWKMEVSAREGYPSGCFSWKTS
jgi:hypothetical protein